MSLNRATLMGRSAGWAKNDDNQALNPYAQAMAEGRPYIRMTLDVRDAVELGDFVNAFTSLAKEYDRYVRAVRPDVAADASLYVSEVRKGSIEAIIIPIVLALPEALKLMDNALTVEDFVQRYGRRISAFLRRPSLDRETTKGELKDIYEQVAAIANIPGSTLEIAAIEVEHGEHRVRAAFKFNTTQARAISENVEIAKRTLDHISRADHERVLMVFIRSDVRGASVGKRSGELVEIAAVSERPLPLIYASELAERQIKDQIADDDSVYKKGFVVDVNVQERTGRPVAYAVTHLHQIIDLPDD